MKTVDKASIKVKMIPTGLAVKLTKLQIEA